MKKFTEGEYQIRGNKIFIKDTYIGVATVHTTEFTHLEDVVMNNNAELLSKSKEMHNILCGFIELSDEGYSTDELDGKIRKCIKNINNFKRIP